MTVVAAVVAGTALLLALPTRPEIPGERVGSRPVQVIPFVLPALLVAVALLGLQALVLLLIASVALGGAIDLVRRERRRREAAVLRRRVVEMVEALAGEVRAGRDPSDALIGAVGEFSLLRGPAETARLGGDVPAALRAIAVRPGAESLVPMAASWQLSVSAGAGLADALDRAAAQARADLGVSTLVAGELASARATARLLAVLPFLVLALGRGLGFDPWGVLFRSWVGVGCLAAGVVLALAGLRWVDRIGDQGDHR
jgi:tight adherence protein B